VVHAVLRQGNFVLVVDEGEFDNNPSVFYDFYRMEDKMMVEHWDVIKADSAPSRLEKRQRQILSSPGAPP
jgi:predicted SnoaL-like aldol condensation-catalyzing enzyme